MGSSATTSARTTTGRGRLVAVETDVVGDELHVLRDGLRGTSVRSTRPT
jgi:hypothetical protein